MDYSDRCTPLYCDPYFFVLQWYFIDTSCVLQNTFQVNKSCFFPLGRKAQEARERYVRQAMGMDSNGSVTYGRPTAAMRRNSLEGSDPYSGTSYLSGHTTNHYPTAYRSTSYNDSLHAATSKELVQPSTQEEEQLQMQIALAESQREVSINYIE